MPRPTARPSMRSPRVRHRRQRRPPPTLACTIPSRANASSAPTSDARRPVAVRGVPLRAQGDVRAHFARVPSVRALRLERKGRPASVARACRPARRRRHVDRAAATSSHCSTAAGDDHRSHHGAASGGASSSHRRRRRCCSDDGDAGIRPGGVRRAAQSRAEDPTAVRSGGGRRRRTTAPRCGGQAPRRAGQRAEGSCEARDRAAVHDRRGRCKAVPLLPGRRPRTLARGAPAAKATAGRRSRLS